MVIDRFYVNNMAAENSDTDRMSSLSFSFLATGIWGVGVATQKVNLNQVPMGRDTHSLVLRHDGSVYHNNEEKNRLPANSLPQEGDVVVSVCVCVCVSTEMMAVCTI